MRPRRARWWTALSGLLALLAIAVLLAPAPVQAQPQAEVRALWVDAFHDGIKTPAQVNKLVAEARRANVNTLLVQVRRRGDLYYKGGPEPMADDIAPRFDPLEALLEAAHSGSPRLEVQAWMAVYPLWHRQHQPPNAAGHLLHRHGNGANGEDNWLMQRDDGETWTGEAYWLDPGHPAVNGYLVDLMADLVERYEVDGLHLDRLRYHQEDRRWGYNPASVTRFGLERGRSGQPEPDDAQWGQYRRDRVTDLLRQTRDRVLAIRPGLKLSAAVVPWGPGPRRDADWITTSAYNGVFQDWRAWLEAGLLDQAYVMNYNRESSAQQVGWQESWFAWQRGKGYGRQVVAGLAPYLNSPEETIQQIRRALGPGQDGARLSGVALYSYAVPDPSRDNGDPADDSPPGYLWDLLARPAEANGFNPPFAEPVAAPGMSWRTDQPERGARKR